MKKSLSLGKYIYLCGIILLVIWGGIRFYNNVQFNLHCEGYLKRAADAPDITLAKEELQKAVFYARNHNLTEGYTTAIFWKDPSEDIGYWYRKLNTAYKQLEKADMESISNWEESNLLIKLREALLNPDGSVIVPQGISVFPYNTLLAVLFILGLIVFTIGYIIKRGERYVTFDRRMKNLLKQQGNSGIGDTKKKSKWLQRMEKIQEEQRKRNENKE